MASSFTSSQVSAINTLRNLSDEVFGLIPEAYNIVLAERQMAQQLQSLQQQMLYLQQQQALQLQWMQSSQMQQVFTPTMTVEEEVFTTPVQPPAPKKSNKKQVVFQERENRKPEKSQSWADQCEESVDEFFASGFDTADEREQERLRELEEMAAPLFEQEEQRKKGEIQAALDQANFPTVQAARKTFFEKKESTFEPISDAPKTAAQLVRSAAVKPTKVQEPTHWVDIARTPKVMKPRDLKFDSNSPVANDDSIIRRICRSKTCKDPACFYVKRNDSDVIENVSPDSIFLANLPRDYPYENVREALRKETEQICRVPKSTFLFTEGEGDDKTTSGFAIITFATHQQACDAIKLFGKTNFYGQKLIVNFRYMLPKKNEKAHNDSEEADE
jgi:hypothetical protein